MKYNGRSILIFLASLSLVLTLCACGSSPWRYDPGTPEAPSGVVATAGDGQVSLSFAPVAGAAGYNVYYASAPGLAAGSGAKVASIAGGALVVPGLDNGTRYYFAVSAFNSNSESELSPEVSAVPALSGPFRQADLQGSWRFNALSGGVDARWMRGVLLIDAAGSVSVDSYLDSEGGSVAPVGLFGIMALQPDGSVSQEGAVAPFHGVLAANLYKDLMVATTTLGGGERVLAILQKSVPGISFSDADIRGTGRLVAGPLPFVYHQLSAGLLPEWEHASCQVGQDQGVTYVSLTGPAPRPLPGGGSKVVTLSITSGGLVSETPYPGVVPQPAALMTQGVMSADKLTVVATATDLSGRPLLRIMQMVHPPAVPLNVSSYQAGELSGNYAFHELFGGGSPGWGYGAESVDASGGAFFSSYLDADGSGALPAGYVLAMDQQGALSAATLPSYHGQFSYDGALMVMTGTRAEGAPALGIAVRR